ncbi:MAG: type II toxin-antitoxin system RelE/ParE family toxin [Gemmatimonadota bacterium]|nr:type II toxin-antitoxin system RelE/ParE family toxin [Gemmatimonadota bacterium]
MSRRLVFRPQALQEVFEAAEWYEERSPGLSAEFLRTLDAAIASIRRNPQQNPAVHEDMHRALLRRFPYSLIYSFSDEETVILACTHWRQHPRRWRNRR